MTRVVLTADRTLMSEYQKNMFFGFSASFPKKFIPSPLYFRMFAPPVPERNGEAEFAPYSIRKMEAALVRNGYDPSDVVVAHPDHLGRFVAKDTSVLAISTMDPLGRGPVTSTYTDLYSAPAYVSGKFRELILGPSVRKHRPKIIVGGPGSWQLDKWPSLRDELGIDCVVDGEGEITFPKLVRMAEEGRELPRTAQGEVVPLEKMPNIVKPSINAMVEVARGCGRGCKFCTPTLQSFRCRPLEDIMEEVRVNVNAGRSYIYVHAEDIWRYGAKGIRPDREKVVELFRTIYRFEGVSRVFPSHGALASVACDRKILPEVSDALELNEDCINGYQTGIETASPELIRKHMKGKVKPFKPDEWPQVVREAFEISVDSHWMPCSTLIMGLPGETDDDVIKTIELVDDLGDLPSGVFPLFFVAMGTMIDRKSFQKSDLNQLYWELMVNSWEHNLKYFPYLLEHGGMENPFWNLLLTRFLLPYAKKKLEEYTASHRLPTEDPAEEDPRRNGGILARFLSF